MFSSRTIGLCRPIAECQHIQSLLSSLQVKELLFYFGAPLFSFTPVEFFSSLIYFYFVPSNVIKLVPPMFYLFLQSGPDDRLPSDVSLLVRESFSCRSPGRNVTVCCPPDTARWEVIRQISQRRQTFIKVSD